MVSARRRRCPCTSSEVGSVGSARPHTYHSGTRGCCEDLSETSGTPVAFISVLLRICISTACPRKGLMPRDTLRSSLNTDSTPRPHSSKRLEDVSARGNGSGRHGDQVCSTDREMHEKDHDLPGRSKLLSEDDRLETLWLNSDKPCMRLG